MLATRSNVPLKAAEARLLQARHSLGIGVRIAKIVRYIAKIAPSRFIGICPFIGYAWVQRSHFFVYTNDLQKWNGLYFEKVTLKSLGLRHQLGHLDGVCSLPQPAFNDDFVVIDIDGIHEVAIDYCGCQQSLPKTVQLLRARLFPSTVFDPKTAATFHVLETFQMLSFTSKVSAFEFY